MSKNVIEIHKLGKSYIIGNKKQGERYTALRDVISERVAKLWSKIRHPEYHTHENLQEFWALKDIDLEVKQGERLGIIGRNGAGKTTLLKVLSRITEPTTGQIKVKGRIASLLEVGTGFHPELTGRENVYLNGSVLGMSRAEIKRNFDEIVDFAGVEQFLDTPVKRYSSGMLVRLGFSVAAHLEPEILLVDEVLAVGDVEFQKKCLGKMERVAEQGRTVLFVSHNMGQIAKLCSRIILLEDSSVKVDGESSTVINEYVQSSIIKSYDKTTESECIIKNDTIDIVSYSVYGEKVGSSPTTGKMCNIAITLDFKKEVRNPGLMLSIKSTSLDNLLYISTQPISGLNTGKCYGKVHFTLLLEQLPLTGGIYILMVGAKHIPFQPIIPLAEIARFEVLAEDYYSSGHLLYNKTGFLAVKHSWTIEKE